jgi:hypothetical protein
MIWEPSRFDGRPFAPLADVFADPLFRGPRLPPVASWPPVAGVRFETEVRRRRGESFVPSDLYDGQIVARAVVPSREENLHDLFNMVAWRAFPNAKAALHRRQYAALCGALGDAPRTTLPNRRLPVQDRLTLLDEASFVLPVPPTWELSRPLTREDVVGELAQRLVPFGHGLVEFLYDGRVGDGRGFVLPIPTATTDRGAVDEAIADLIATERLPMARRLGFSFCRALIGA